MNSYVYTQRNAMGGCEEKEFESVVCPKPRRLGISNPTVRDQIRPFRCRTYHQSEAGGYGSGGGELLDMILAQGNYEKPNNQMPSSPPYFYGSPPSRASNPVTQDAHFNSEKLSPISPRISSGGCVRMKFGQKPALVRVEGFDCLNRDQRHCSISAVA